jgi:signal peptidase I
LTDDDRQRAAETPAGDAVGDNAPAAAPAATGAGGVANPAAGAAPYAEADVPGATIANPADDERARSEAALAGMAEGIGLRAGVVGKKGSNWFADLKAILWLLLAVLAFHSCVAKPFYIPSESMMPGLLKGDRLVVSKYPYGWSWVSPSFHIFPHWQGRIWGRMPRRGDIVIVTPPGGSSDYIKRVIGLPGDTIQVIDGEVWLNGQRLRREARPAAMIPIDDNIACRESMHTRRIQQNGRWFCQMRVFREYIPDGGELRAYDTIDSVDNSGADEFPHDATLYRVRENRVFLMGDNRDDSADSRVALEDAGLGGDVPWENIGGRAEFITFSLDGSSSYWNPISWFTALRGGRAGTSLHPASEPLNQGTPRP